MYLIFYKQVEHVVGQLPLWTVLNRKLHHLCLDFGLFGLWRLVRLLLCFDLFWGSLKKQK